MRLEIKKVKACRNKAYGNFLLRGRDTALITVSMKLNTTLAEYATTVLHELLHLWITLLRKEGFKLSNRKEHSFIYAVEAIVVKLFQRTKGGR